MTFLALRRAPLCLVPSTLPLALAERRGPQALSAALRVAVPDSWPPPLTEDTFDWAITALTDPSAFPWQKWYVLLEAHGSARAIGVVGIKGPPKDRRIEIGYSILPDFQRRGYATMAAGVLLDWVRSTAWVDEVVADTLPELIASQKVLQKNRFEAVGPGPEIGTLRYRLRLV